MCTPHSRELGIPRERNIGVAGDIQNRKIAFDKAPGQSADRNGCQNGKNGSGSHADAHPASAG